MVLITIRGTARGDHSITAGQRIRKDARQQDPELGPGYELLRKDRVRARKAREAAHKREEAERRLAALQRQRGLTVPGRPPRAGPGGGGRRAGGPAPSLAGRTPPRTRP